MSNLKKLCICLIAAHWLNGCTSTKLLLTNSLARLQDFTVINDLDYGKHELNKLSLYLPSRPKNRFGTVVFFYGGCWGGCITYEKEDYVFVAEALTSRGYAVAIPDYRRYPEVKFTEIITDAGNSVKWVKSHIADYGGDSNKIFLMGHSAGAHLGAMLTLNETYLPPTIYKSLKGFIGLAGPYDFLPFTEYYQSALFGPTENHPSSQPINFVNGTEPPMLLLAGLDDTTVKPSNSEKLQRKIRNKGGCSAIHEYPKTSHAGLLAAFALPLQDKGPILADIIRFLDYYSEANKPCVLL